MSKVVRNRQAWVALAAVLLCVLRDVAIADSSSDHVSAMGHNANLSRITRLSMESDRFVVGRVRRVEGHERGPNGQAGIHTRIVLNPYQTLPGGGNDRIVFWFAGGSFGRKYRRLTGQPRLDVGDEVVVFLVSDGTTLWLAPSQYGAWSLERGRIRWRVRNIAPKEYADPDAWIAYEQLVSAAGVR